MLGFDNPIHIAFLLILLLLVFGAKRLPEMGRSLGSGLRGFKESINGDHSPTNMSGEHTPAHLDAFTSASATTPDPVAEPVLDGVPVRPAA